LLLFLGTILVCHQVDLPDPALSWSTPLFDVACARALYAPVLFERAAAARRRVSFFAAAAVHQSFRAFFVIAH